MFTLAQHLTVCAKLSKITSIGKISPRQCNVTADTACAGFGRQVKMICPFMNINILWPSKIISSDIILSFELLHVDIGDHI
jgi:hypothetical protein